MGLSPTSLRLIYSKLCFLIKYGLVLIRGKTFAFSSEIHKYLSTSTNLKIIDFGLKPLILEWSGRRESNPHTQLGKLVFYH